MPTSSPNHELDTVDLSTISDKKLTYIQQQVEQNLTFHMNCRDGLADRTFSLTKFLFGASTVALGLAVKIQPDNPVMALCLFGLALYYFVFVLILMFSGRALQIPALGNEPKNLIKEEWLSFDDNISIGSSLCSSQRRIEKLVYINCKKGLTINVIQLFIALSPLLFFIAYIILRQECCRLPAS